MQILLYFYEFPPLSQDMMMFVYIPQSINLNSVMYTSLAVCL